MLAIKVAFSFPPKNIYFLRNQHTHIIIIIICVEFERKNQHKIGFPIFKLPTSSKHLL